MDLSPFTAYLAVERGLAPSTAQAYARSVRELGPEPLQLQSSDLRRMLHSRAGASATVARRLAAWRSFYGWAVRTGERADDPTIDLDRPKLTRGLPRPVDDLEAVLHLLDAQMQSVAVFLAETGLRISEACSVDVGAVPADLIVRGKGSKERIVPLSGLAQDALAELGGHMPVSARTIQRHLASVGITPHRLRHTFATSLAEADVDLSVIQDLLGHASPATTRVYTRNQTARLRAGIERRGRH